jgi:RNA polymerase sigma factor (sigma-70 family)
MTDALGDAAGADADLLCRFADSRDDGAFEALVRRHGPMVLAVCRRVLGNEADAEDAFQATFLVLLRKAGSLARPASLACWLHGVAHRTALEARGRGIRRRAKERHLMPAQREESTPQEDWADLRAVLDREVSLLPGKYRQAFVLCHVQGRTNEEAARLLGCPKGTIMSRLAWARERLRLRLSRRGIGLLAALLALADAPAVPPELLDSTVRAADAAASVPAEVAALTEGVLKAMRYAKVKGYVWSMLAAVAACAAGLLGYGGLAAEGKGKTDKEKLQGTWVIVSEERGGKKINADAEEIKGATLTIKGDKATLTMGGRTQEATFTIDLGKTPKEIDLTGDDGGGVMTHLGIYKLEGDVFTLCKSHPPEARPDQFASKEGERWPAVFVFKRAKNK